MSGAIALVGSGEYLPAMLEVERLLLANADSKSERARYIQIPTAAGQESRERIAYWKSLGKAQAERLGCAGLFLPILTRDDASKGEYLAAVDGAALIYLSGGDPSYLANTLRGTPLWAAIERNWRAGSSIAGCSAGAMALNNQLSNFFRPKAEPVAGLGIITGIKTIPHYNKFFGWVPDRAAQILLGATAGSTVIGIDENTAVITGLKNDPEANFADNNWRVFGAGKVHLIKGNFPATAQREFLAGEILRL